MKILIRRVIAITAEKIAQFFVCKINKTDWCILLIILFGYIGISRYWFDDTLNSLSISMLASGIFYVFSIYVPKLMSISTMKKLLREFLPRMDNSSSLIITQIKKNITGKEYTVDEFVALVDTKDKDDGNLLVLKNDFNTYYTSSNDKTDQLMSIMECQRQIICNIYSKYSKILPTRIGNHMSSYCDFCNLSLSLSKKDKKYILALFDSVKEFLNISKGLKSYYFIDKKFYSDEFYKQLLEKKKEPITKKMKIMKKYFNVADITAFISLIVSIVWVSLYKFYWIYDKPIFSGADTVAGITDTVASSVIASAIFYIITIFIPKYVQIKRMKKDLLLFYLGRMDDHFSSNEIFDQIPNINTHKNYTQEEFLADIKENEKYAKKCFIDYYNKNQFGIIRFCDVYDAFHKCVDDILLKYKDKDLLPLKLVDDLTKYLKFNPLGRIKDSDNSAGYCFSHLEQMLNLYLKLRNI